MKITENERGRLRSDEGGDRRKTEDLLTLLREDDTLTADSPDMCHKEQLSRGSVKNSNQGNENLSRGRTTRLKRWRLDNFRLFFYSRTRCKR